ncbi:glycosyltransferase family 4 protein [Arcticibacter sp. MXS-1]|uniref:glycosyltransferase family 4 protein n=1 Tax=Arcticibacter sp. MXS-1 TaxID=3341726 RepID=UPI0035A85815
MTVAIDTKNLALFTGGISAFVKPLIRRWLEERPDLSFVLVGPDMDVDWLQGLSNFKIKRVSWPTIFPRQLRHPLYDLILFPYALRQLKPNFIFTPYHDVLLPKGVPAVMMIHDTCILELRDIYPKPIYLYYNKMLRVNLKRAKNVLTVSNASKIAIIKHYQVDENVIQIVPNSLDLPGEIRRSYQGEAKDSLSINLFYAGGADYRKNIKNLVKAVNELGKMGYEVSLKVTGSFNRYWERELEGVDSSTVSKLNFLGFLSTTELQKEYAEADVVVYPSLCEGFGRVCLEAMAVGAALACSDLAVLKEVSGDYAVYFDPLNVKDIAEKIVVAKNRGRQQPVLKDEYKVSRVTELFVETMDRFIHL